MVNRRTFLHSALALLVAGCSSAPLVTKVSPTASRKRGGLRCFVPGYRSKYARYQGKSVLENASWIKHIPANYDGPMTMLTRLGGKEESVRRVIYPIQGHGLCLNADGRTGFFAANKHADNNMVAFDTDSLEPVKVVPVHRKGWYGGGHAVYSRDGANLFISERSPERPFSGKLKDHFGGITVRDASTYKVVSAFSCHGIAPHEIKLTADDRYLLVANYGSTRPNGTGNKNSLPEIIEPSITILEADSGRLVDKVVGSRKDTEIRHLSAVDLQRIFAIQVRIGDNEDLRNFMKSSDTVYERDMTAYKNHHYFPAKLLQMGSDIVGQARLHEISRMSPQLSRHGLSIIHEPIHNEILASYPSSHALMVIDASNGQLKQQIRTDQLGLRFPCGLALHPDGQHYIVTGYWRNMYVFERGKHSVNREACQYVSLFGHSHIAV